MAMRWLNRGHCTIGVVGSFPGFANVEPVDWSSRSVHLPVKSALLQCRPRFSSPCERQKMLKMSCEFLRPLSIYIAAEGMLYEGLSFLNDGIENMRRERRILGYVD